MSAIKDMQRRAYYERIKMGALMGVGVGGAAGLLFGSIEASRYRGIPTSQRIGLVLRSSVGMGAAFGFFLCIGTALRSTSADHEQ